MGGGGKGGKKQKEPQASKAQAQIAQQLFTQTDPLRNMLISDSISFLGGDPTQAPAQPPQPRGGLAGVADKVGGGTPQALNVDPNRQPFQFNAAGTPEFQFTQGAANRRFDQAKQNILANTAPGGGLTQALAGAEIERANTLTGAEANIFDKNINRAFSLATGQPFTGSGLGQAASTQAQIAQANAAQNAATKGGIGSAAGLAIGMGGK